jgi:hypothetical protein
MIQAQLFDPGQEMLVGIPLPARQQAAIQPAPSFVILFRVQLVGLVDVKLTLAARLLDKRSFVGRFDDTAGMPAVTPKWGDFEMRLKAVPLFARG